MSIRKLAVTIPLIFAALAFTGGTASALNGNPAGETLEHCKTAPKNSPCVDTKGWGVRVKTAKGDWTENYGPESYKYKRVDGKLFYTFTKDAKPYGKMKFPRGIDY